MKTLFLPKKLKSELRKPFGKLILGRKKEVFQKFGKFLKKRKFKKIITVGDYCSLNLFSQVKIFDGKIRRKRIKKILPYSLKCKNPRGTIRKEVWPKVKEAIEKNKNLFVEGEEDLLVIPSVLLSENGNLVVYGFFKKGICLVEVSKKTKKILKKLLKEFKTL